MKTGPATSAPDGITVPVVSFAENDWRLIERLQRELAEARGQLDEARKRMQEHKDVTQGVAALHRQMVNNTAPETAPEQMAGLMQRLVSATGKLDASLGFDNGLRNAHTELLVKARQLEMTLAAERAAGNARAEYLTREVERVAQIIPGLENTIRRERAEAVALQARLDAMERTC